MNADKNYCMSSYLAFRYIADPNKDFYTGKKHRIMPAIPDSRKTLVKTAEDIDAAFRGAFDGLKGEKLGLLLSGGMDSAILAAYMPGGDAYTFRFLGGDFQRDELQRAESFAAYYGLNLHYVDISWDTIRECTDQLMMEKGAPIHSIEPQIMLGALQAKRDGVTKMVIGNASDYVFGGMDKLLSMDWSYEAFVKRYIYLNPADIIIDAVNVTTTFEKYRQGEGIDFIGFMADVAVDESYSSYFNAFATAQMPYFDPYMELKMAEPLDLNRVRNGESKYLIRQLFAKKYPGFLTPEKNPMPRPVDQYFADWTGPTRPEFKRNLDMSKFTGNQKWQLWCLERFLNLFDPV